MVWLKGGAILCYFALFWGRRPHQIILQQHKKHKQGMNGSGSSNNTDTEADTFLIDRIVDEEDKYAKKKNNHFYYSPWDEGRLRIFLLTHFSNPPTHLLQNNETIHKAQRNPKNFIKTHFNTPKTYTPTQVFKNCTIPPKPSFRLWFSLSKR